MEPEFSKGDKVEFIVNGKKKKGIIVTVDTYFQLADVTYDIYVAKDECLYKHFDEPSILGRVRWW